MDVTSATKQTTRSLDVLSMLNGQKTNASSTWDGALNKASAATKSLMGLGANPVHPLKTLENAKVSALSPSAFGDLLSKKLQTTTEAPEALSDEKRAKLEKTSSTLVNQFFMGSMLKEMRSSPFKSEIFSGGKGGDAYAGLFDQQIAEHSGNRIAKSLVKSMVKQYSKTSSAVENSSMTGGAK